MDCNSDINWRKESENSLDSIRSIVNGSLAPVSNLSQYSKGGLDKHKLGDYLADLKKLGFNDLETLLRLLNSEVKGQQDDSKLLLENLIKLLAKWDEGSVLGEKLSNAFIANLWNATDHPPTTSLGSQYKYRDADGGNNNIRLPDLGRANTPYSRAAKPVKIQKVNQPDPGVIFDSLMVRGGKFEPHPNKISSMLFYLATIIIHDIFRTDHNDFNISKTSSYLDLAPLYGSNQEEQNTVRTFEDGKLKPDCFSEKRILGFPPGVGVMLIMFNRFHNYVVSKLAAIDENGRFQKPRDLNDKDAWTKYDNDLFQTGRLITCGLYVNCVLKDYVRTILNLNRTDSKYNLDPRSEEGKSLFSKPVAEGLGNQVSAEFNVIYRWHSAISERDDKWTQEMYAKLFPGKDPDQVSFREFVQTLSEFEQSIPKDPLERNFENLVRNIDGSFSDDDLVKILKDSIHDVAGSFGANRVPKILRSVGILGIVQSRSWNLASLNEFREASGLVKHKTFKDINPDPDVCEKLQRLYDHPDCVELFTGIMTEKAKPPITPGSGLCVNFTTSYAILADAVALVRGDRFYTVDYTAKSLTNWGYKETQYDTSINEGCVLYKLILRAFPNHFKDNSIYAHFPFVIPDENLNIQKSLNREEKYSWEKPSRIPQPAIVKSHAAAQKILGDQENWKFIGGQNVSFLTSISENTYGLGFNFSGSQDNDSLRSLLKRSTNPSNLETEVKKFFQETIERLIDKYAYEAPGKNSYELDIVRDISNLVNVRFVSTIFGLPIKTEDSPEGIFTDEELYEILSLLYSSIVYNYDVARSFEIREAARRSSLKLGKSVFTHIKSIASPSLFADILARLHESQPLASYGTCLIQGMLDAKLSIEDIAWNHVLPASASLAAAASQTFCQVLDFYLGEGAKYLPDLYACSHANSPEADMKLERYFMEGTRLSSTNSVYRDYYPVADTTEPSVIVDDEKAHLIPIGRRVLVDLSSASRDPLKFSNPNEVDLTRPIDSYLHYGFGPYNNCGKDIGIIAMTAMLKSVFGLKGLRRAEGSGPDGSWCWGESQGQMKKIQISPCQFTYMTPEQTSFCPYPTTMKVFWDID